MEVLVIGGHGKVGLRLLRLLARDGHRGRGVIRNPEQASDLESAGADPVLCDLERGDDLRPHLGTADAIVFAAGAGPGSGPARKRTVDYGAAVKSMEAAGDLGLVLHHMSAAGLATTVVDAEQERYLVPGVALQFYRQLGLFSAVERCYFACSGQGIGMVSSSRMRRWVPVSRSSTIPLGV